MKLFYAAGSPYARSIRGVLRETGLDRRVPEEEVTLRDLNSGLLAYNPGGKVPTLQLDDGTILNESLLVLCFLDTSMTAAACCRWTAPMAGTHWPIPAGRMPFSTRSPPGTANCASA